MCLYIAYLLSVYTYNEQLIFRCRTIGEALRILENMRNDYYIIGFDLRKVPNTKVKVKKGEIHE